MYMLMDIYTCMYTQSIMASIYIYVDRYSYQDLCHLLDRRDQLLHGVSLPMPNQRHWMLCCRLGGLVYIDIYINVSQRGLSTVQYLYLIVHVYMYIYMYIRCLTYTFICVRVYIH